ncbi:MAG: LytTR family DNA-binding domain-containing protein [Bacteroidaceae bacterium]|nr:LytTR family DNA-binding domain-containing protein [Bacteroidaceae bacterium]
MLRVIAIDDEPLALRQIVSYINKVPSLQLVAQCLSAIEAQHILDRDEIDAIFCDINMPDLNGLEFVRMLQNPPLVVFTTAYSEYAIEGFKVEAVDYLLKPYTFKEFSQTVERLSARVELQKRAKAADEVDPEDVIYVRADRMDISVPLSTIRAVLGMGEYLRIYTTDRPRPIVTLATMKSMEERLPSDRFMRIHRSSIVALSHIRKVAKGRLLLSDGMELSVGDNYRPSLDTWMNQHSLS